MSRASLGAIVVLAVAAGLALRFARLDVRPMHHDEANQAVKFGTLLEHGAYRYDPEDHHGPTLYYLSLPAAWLRRQPTLASLDERTLRGVPAAFGAATVLLLPLVSVGIGRTAVATSAWLLALSPAMVFYSRMFIQESLFVFFSLAFVIALGRVATSGGRVWSVLAGIAAGMAVATKETSIIVLPAAIASCAWSLRSVGPGEPGGEIPRRQWRKAALVSMVTAGTVAALFYSAFFTAPGELLAPFRAAATYLNRGAGTAGHAHPWHYYLGLVTYSSSGGLRWTEGLAVVLALAGALTALRAPNRSSLARVFWARYLTCYVVVVAAIFSVVPYKTPWNILPFYAGVLVLAGIGFSSLLHSTRSRAWRGALAAAVVITSGHLGWQAWRAAVTYASDPRNPYVYAQTVPDAVRMANRIRGLAAVHVDSARMQVSVIASPYEQWPLPWYLRAMPHIGYWTAPGEPLAMSAPVIVSSTDHSAVLDNVLGDRYVSEFYGLRPDVLLTLYIERGLWDRFLAGTSGQMSGAAPALAAQESTR